MVGSAAEGGKNRIGGGGWLTRGSSCFSFASKGDNPN